MIALRRHGPFVATTEHQRFVEFANAVRQNRYIGLCFGAAGEDQAHIELVIIDEADRLSHAALERSRDLFDRADFGLILIGMPGIEKRMPRYPQFYSRVGFAHHFHPLQGKNLSFVTTHHCRKVCSSALRDSPNAKAIAAISRITGGNFRLLHRLLVQIERVLEINKRTAITAEVIEAARNMLVIGAD